MTSRSMTWCLSLILGFVAGEGPLTADETADEIAALKQRLDALEASKRDASKPVSKGEQKLRDFMDKTTWHGYTDVHYNNPKEDKLSHKDFAAETDIHRMALGLTHELTDKTRIEFEVDFEHAASEIELDARPLWGRGDLGRSGVILEHVLAMDIDHGLLAQPAFDPQRTPAVAQIGGLV